MRGERVRMAGGWVRIMREGVGLGYGGWRFFASLRMTRERVRMTGERVRIMREGVGLGGGVGGGGLAKRQTQEEDEHERKRCWNAATSRAERIVQPRCNH